MPRRKDWYLFSVHGLVFLALAQDPNLTVDQIAQKIGRSRWTVIRILRDLQLADYLKVARKGTRNAYTLNEQASFANPILLDRSLGDLVDLFREERG